MISSTTLIGVSDQTYQPTLSQLRAFVAVAEYRHFGTAAVRLSVSQPTLSQALAALEAGLGAQLIERSTRKVLVTAVGQTLLPLAIAALDASDRFVAAAAGDGSSGPLRIGIIPTIAPYILPSVLPQLRTEMPRHAVHVVEDQTARLLDSLRVGVLDVAIVALPTEANGMVEIPLYTEPFALVVPKDHELAGRDDLSPQVLGGLPLLLLDDGHCLRDQALDVCRAADAHPDTAGDTRATSLATVVQCVAGGLGVTLVPEMALDVETAGADLAVARFADPAPGRTVGLAFRASSARADDYRRLADILRTGR